MKNSSWLAGIAEDRLLSLDVYRGFAMLLLITEATGLYELLINPSLKGTLFYAIGQQFHHSTWQGLTLWDMGQSFFMFISGVAMAFSYGRRFERGINWKNCLAHAALRAALLFLLGWALYIVNPPEGASGWTFLLDILPALAFGSFLSFLIIKWPTGRQLAFSVFLLLASELLYRLCPAEGFNQPYVPGHNFGSYLDLKLWGNLNQEGWVTFNLIPSATYVIAGLIIGKLLRSNKVAYKKLKIITVAAIGLSGLGLLLSTVTPIIKKISTSSFVVISIGASLLFLALAFWVIDLLKFRRLFFIPLTMGLNPLFIFLFARSGGADLLLDIFHFFSKALLGWAGPGWVDMGASLSSLAMMCAICYFLFEKKIIIKI